MDTLAPFRLPVTSLKADEGRYEWQLDQEFFRYFDDEHETEKGDFSVTMDLAHTGTITTLTFSVSGLVETACDRCLVPIKMPINGEYEIIVKFGNPDETNDEVIFVDPESSGLNVAKHIYDFVLLSIPIVRRIEGCTELQDRPCDMTILSYLSESKKEDIPPSGDDPLWGDLRKAIDN